MNKIYCEPHQTGLSFEYEGRCIKRLKKRLWPLCYSVFRLNRTIAGAGPRATGTTEEIVPRNIGTGPVPRRVNVLPFTVARGPVPRKAKRPKTRRHIESNTPYSWTSCESWTS